MRPLIVSIAFILVTSFHCKASDFLSASQSLVKRITKNKFADFRIEKLTSTDNKDVFEIESNSEGQIILRGNSLVSIASALHWYLKYYCFVQISWNNLDVTLPETLPQVKPMIRKESSYQDRSYFNYCTFSYSAAFWDWERWEKEIDWMALHGITMPLMITGQEAVWYNTLKQFNMTDEEICEFLVGPAFFAWQWMTNIEQWGGPLPKSWINNSITLGRRIIKRQRELGMTPVLQGFTGYVPLKLQERFPQSDITKKPLWLRYFQPGTAQLDPLDPFFEKIGTVFLKEQEKLFGTNHLYAADPFHEGEPPKNYPGYLAEVGKSIYSVTQKVDSKAIIVMQSWSFRPDIAYAIPKDRLLVFDLNSSKSKQFDYFKGRAWHGGIIHNFGGTSAMGGNLESIAKRLTYAGKDTTYKNYVGFGLFPEAIENNPIIYELAAELAWHDHIPNIDEWIQQYTKARYGTYNDDISKAWQVLRHTVYGNKRGVTVVGESPICARPHLRVKGASPNSRLTSPKDYNFAELWQAPLEMFNASSVLSQNPNYRYDLVDVMRQCLSDLSISIQQNLEKAYESGNIEEFDKSTTQFLELILDMDELLATNEHFTLGKWINGAKRMAKTPEEMSLYEKNARWLVTVWGPYDKGAILFDYSNRQWSGLFKDFYYVRWERYIDFLKEQLSLPENQRYKETSSILHRFGRPANEANDFYSILSKWEYDWCDQTKTYPSEAIGDTFTVAYRLFNKWNHLAAILYSDEDNSSESRIDPDKKKVIFGID